MPILLAFGLILCKNGHQVVGATFSEPDLDYLCWRSAGGHPLRCPPPTSSAEMAFPASPVRPLLAFNDCCIHLAVQFPGHVISDGTRGFTGRFRVFQLHTPSLVRPDPGSDPFRARVREALVHCLSLWIRSHREAFPAAFSEAVRTALLF